MCGTHLAEGAQGIAGREERQCCWPMLRLAWPGHVTAPCCRMGFLLVTLLVTPIVSPTESTLRGIVMTQHVTRTARLQHDILAETQSWGVEAFAAVL
jgi:hypothetical protein